MLAWAVAAAEAAEVVWVAPPSSEDAARVAALAGAKGGPLSPADLLGDRFGAEESAAYERLAASLAQVRPYETRLDGELLIMEELAGPIAAVKVVRNPQDRVALTAALAYQGFAIDRYFADDLAKDDRAAAYRVEIDGMTVPRAWADAVAMDPDHELTPYDIAEAPQRVRYNQWRGPIARQLPARLVPVDLPADAVIVVDGKPATPGPTGSIAVVPGHHLVHVELPGGRIGARYDLRLASNDKAEVKLPISPAEVEAWAAAVAHGDAPATPAGLEGALARIGEVWIAAPGPGGPQVWAIGPSGPTAVTMPKPERADGDGGWSVSAQVAGGWLYTADFYTQDAADLEPTRALVNAATIGLGASVDDDIGALRLGVGVDSQLTLGANHVALYGDTGRTRLRTTPWVGVGIKPVGVIFGWTFPHHPSAGLRVAIPLGDSGLELRGLALAGLGLTRTRDGADAFDGSPLAAANAGIGWRF